VPLTWSDIVLRSLYYLGLLAAGGATLFGLAVRRLVRGRLLRPLAQLLFFGLLAVFVGGSGIVHTAAPGTRYVLVMKVVLGVAVAGGVAAALAPARPRLVVAAGAAALSLLAAPTLAGHALDPNQPWPLAAPADVLHLAAAASWLGVLLGLAWVLPRAGGGTAAVTRASGLALAAVLVLAVTGLARAATELSAVSQAWSTSYGRALLAKTALFGLLATAGAVNRRRLGRGLALVRGEILLVAAVVVVVAVLTELRPGRDRAYSPPPPAASPISR
jgi:copper transport protein